MSAIGPYQPGDIVRIPLEVTINGVPTVVGHPRVQKIILPDMSEMPGFPRYMSTVKPGTYMFEIRLTTIGSYTAILEAEYGNATIEQIAEFVIERPWGFPRIEVASDK
jgi:hypothetical protein